MKKRFYALLLSLAMVLSSLSPAFTTQVNAAEITAYEYEKVTVTKPVANSYTVNSPGTSPSGDGPASWAFDEYPASHWHTNYDASLNTAENINGSSLTWGTVSTIPAFADVVNSRAWIGGAFEGAIELAKVEYTGRTNKSANWIGQYALYIANVTEGEVKDSDFTLAASGTNTGFSKVTIALDTPKTATHFRLVAFTANPAGNNHVSASNIDVYEAVEVEAVEEFGGAIAGTDKQWTDSRFSEVKEMKKTSETLHGWKNDTVISEIALYSAYAEYEDVTATAGEFTDAEGNQLDAEVAFIRSAKAYNGSFIGYGSNNSDANYPADNGTNRSESADIIWNDEPVDMAANTVQAVWVEIDIPEDAKAGSYTGDITVSAKGADTLTFTYNVEVADAVLPDVEDFTETFDMMQWHHPYSSAEYYDVEPFGEEHLAILRNMLDLYKEVGGNSIAGTIMEESWNAQTYSKNPVHYPSMVKWTKNADGTFSYDYSDLDAWMDLVIEMGLGEMVTLYGIAPWHNSFKYWENDRLQTLSFNAAGTATYNAMWKDFLTKFIAHAEEKGWFDRIYLAVDERGVSEAVFALIDSVKNSKGESLKTAADIDNITNHWSVAQSVNALNVGDTAAYKNAARFAELKAIRDEKGLKTTLYSCTEHKPGNFSLSAPVESYWTVLNAGKMDADGFNRWAYDAWVADPLNDTTHYGFEPGDCFVIFPDEKTAENPQAYSSVRLARMAEGVRDVNKMKLMEEKYPELGNEIDAAFTRINTALTTSRSYTTDEEAAALAKETEAFRSALNKLTQNYITLENGGTYEEFTLLNKLPKINLPEEYQSDVEGPYREAGHARRYLGQPDLIRTETGKMITVMPTGHGHGPLVMKISTDDGATWTEKTDIPSSWAESQETPTMYTLQVKDDTQEDGYRERLVLVCACPNWDKYLGGWQMSWSDDDGKTWTEFSHYWPKLEEGGSTHYTIVAMASLIQLKDENGNYKQEWMGVYHDYSYVNYKTILTFAEDGTPQWTKPEPMLAEHRDIEWSHQICEIGLFRSPDGKRIVGLGRNQTHAGPATMFYSDDEGKTWSVPAELPGSLAGERHKALYDPISGKLVISFREIDYDRNDDGVALGTSGDWIAGEWVAWVGTYEQLMNLQQGEYMLMLDYDYSGNQFSGDTGYPGMVVLDDGTFIMHSYGHWDEQSLNVSNVRTDLCWIRQAKFKLSDVENLEPIPVPENANDDSKDYPKNKTQAISESQYLPGTNVEGPDDFILDGSSGTYWHTNWSTSEATDVAKRWIGVSLDEVTAIDGIRYLPRGGNGDVTEYKAQYRATDDGEWIDVASGTWDRTDVGWKLVKFDTVYAKQVRIVGVHTYADSGNDAHMSTAEFRVTVAEEEEPVVEDEGVRLFGSGRYDTGYAVADALKEVLGVDKFEAVVVATGKNFADALAGSYLAVEKNAAILLTNGKDDNVAQLHAYIKENVAEGGKVYILGGEAAVPAAVEAIEGYDVVRLFGDSRYDTNLAILAEAGISGDSVIVATGKTFADSLSASAAKLPILLVKPNAALNDAQKEILAGRKNIYIVGGEGAVSAAYAEELAAYGEVTRVFGDSRYDTSVEIAKTFCTDAEKAVVASGKNFPDGLCGGPLAAALNAPLVLTKDGGAAAAAGYVADNAIASGFVLGGDGALADDTVVEVFGLESADEIK